MRSAATELLTAARFLAVVCIRRVMVQQIWQLLDPEPLRAGLSAANADSVESAIE
jgi:hypothetical protein